MMFLETGCYSMKLPQGILLLSINGMQFSVRNKLTNDPKAPAKIFKWMKEKLESAKRDRLKVILMYHIPHGHFVTPVGTEQYWVPKHEKTLRELLKKYNDIISGIYTGHLHFTAFNASGMSTTQRPSRRSQNADWVKNEINNIKNGAYYGATIVNRGVSPLFDNNPGFSIYYYNEKLTHPDYCEEYTFPITASYNKTNPPERYWKYLYNSKKDLGIEDFSAGGLHKFLEEIIHDYKKFFKYMMYRLGKTNDEPEEVIKVMEAVCMGFSNDLLSYSKCVDSLKEKME